MAMDIDAFEERSAIMEFDGGLTRFKAETAAARAQGFERHEVIHAIRKRNSEQARHQRQAATRDAARDLPGVQPEPKEENRQVFERDVPDGRGAVALPPLRVERRRVL